jgi:predicted nucleic acid-binding Zn ribbon protein
MIFVLFVLILHKARDLNYDHHEPLMSVRLPEHDHCKFCGDPVPFDQAYCSEDCYWNDQAQMKKEKRDNLMFALLTVVSVIAIVAVGLIL